MRRLIDAEPIIRDLTAMKSAYDAISLDGMIKHLQECDTVDAVEVVRCKDCKHYHAGTGWCDMLSFFQLPDGTPCSPAESHNWKMFGDNDFCSCGERKEGTDDE